MAVYKNRDDKSIFSSVDFDDANNTAFFFVKSEVDVDKAKNMLAASGADFIAKSYVKGQTVVIAQSKEPKEELFNKIAAADTGKFELEPEPKKNSLQFIKENGWKLRGGSSIIGQSATVVSAALTPDKAQTYTPEGKLKTKFDPATGMFAVLNLTANFINLIFGGQKEEDVHGLEKFNRVIADEINHYLPAGECKISPDDVRKLSYMNDKEIEEHNKDRSPTGILKRNSVKIGEVGLRTLGSLALVLNYRTVIPGLKKLATGNVKEAWNIAKTQDNFTRIAGYGMVAGKAMGLAAETYDPENPPKTYWQEIKQKVLWRVSSFTEMIAQGSMVYDRAKNKKIVWGNELRADRLGAAGNFILTVPPYPTRLVLPYGQKVLDVNEVHARLLDELPKLPHDKIPEVAARVTARMVEHMGENSPQFSALYKNLLDKLEKYHGISVLPHSQAGKGEAVSVPEKGRKCKSEKASCKSKMETGDAQTEKKFTDKIAPAQKPEIKKANITAAKEIVSGGYVNGMEATASESAIAR